jgi:hypothetical protein
MSPSNYKAAHRLARIGNLGTLAMSTGAMFPHFLSQFDLRFPRIGSRSQWPRTFDSLRQGVKVRRLSASYVSRKRLGIM